MCLGQICRASGLDGDLQCVAAAPKHQNVHTFLQRLLVDELTKAFQILRASCDSETGRQVLLQRLATTMKPC